MTRLIPVVLALVVLPGCRQLLKNADEFGDLARQADRASDLRHADGAVDAMKRVGGWDHAKLAATEIGKLSLDVGPDLVEAAVEQLEEEGEEVATSTADLSGSWTLHQDTGRVVLDGVTERRQLEPGRVAFKQVITTSQGGATILTIRLRGVEALGPKKVCSVVDEVEILKMAESLPPSLVEGLRAGMTPAAMNEDPCDELVEVSADRLATRSDGVTYTEVRAK
jgi:hypothetical protein